MTNRLGQEKSLYLKQHAQNPLHWRAWGDSVFEDAKKANKLVLVSIGYSTCHWCHVMEHETFESQEVADFVNENLLCIKVDREEHPDIDRFYMDALLAIAGHGGWPLNALVTPEGKAFFAFTYLPTGQFLQVLKNVVDVWRQNPDDIYTQAESVMERLKNTNRGESLSLKVGEVEEGAWALLSKKYEKWEERLEGILQENFDAVWGGFTKAPKFPRSHALSAMIRAYESRKNSKTEQAIQHTLKAMAYGGMWDHLGGGFHRYSVDERWHVPHFEKMLYDQSLLLKTYSEAYKVWGDKFYKDICDQLIKHVEAQHLNEDGSVAAAHDADSEGVEGKFFVWDKSEVLEALQDFDSVMVQEFCELYGIHETPNWEEGNIPHLNLDTDWDRTDRFVPLRKRLFAKRAERMAPARDGKAIVSWNAYWFSALAQASHNMVCAGHDLEHLESWKLLKQSEGFIRETLCQFSSLSHIYYGGEGSGAALFEDYVSVWEMLEYLVQLPPFKDLQHRSSELREFIHKNFVGENGKLKNRSEQDSTREAPLDFLSMEDGASPSPISTFVFCELRHALRLQSAEAQENLAQIVARLEGQLQHNPLVMSYLMSEVSFLKKKQLIGMDRKISLEDWQAWVRQRREFPSDYVLKGWGDAYLVCDDRSCQVPSS